jgi:hypothetical protein
MKLAVLFWAAILFSKSVGTLAPRLCNCDTETAAKARTGIGSACRVAAKHAPRFKRFLRFIELTELFGITLPPFGQSGFFSKTSGGLWGPAFPSPFFLLAAAALPFGRQYAVSNTTVTVLPRVPLEVDSEETVPPIDTGTIVVGGPDPVIVILLSCVPVALTL